MPVIPELATSRSYHSKGSQLRAEGTHSRPFIESPNWQGFSDWGWWWHLLSITLLLLSHVILIMSQFRGVFPFYIEEQKAIDSINMY